MHRAQLVHSLESKRRSARVVHQATRAPTPQLRRQFPVRLAPSVPVVRLRAFPALQGTRVLIRQPIRGLLALLERFRQERRRHASRAPLGIRVFSPTAQASLSVRLGGIHSQEVRRVWNVRVATFVTFLTSPRRIAQSGPTV